MVILSIIIYIIEMAFFLKGIRNNQSIMGYGSRQGTHYCCMILSFSIPHTGITTTSGIVVSLKLHLKTYMGWGGWGFCVANTWLHIELIYTTASTNTDNMKSSATRLEQSLLWVIMNSLLMFLLDVFKVDLICYMDMLLFLRVVSPLSI